MYRTGDLVRYLPDGRMHCLGRLDTQVKLRGFRIELGEIEIVLARHPAVQQCAVLVREDVPGDQRLVAYLVSREQTMPAEKDLRAFLKETLPDYMLPTAFVNLEQLPLTPNGKLDRQSLLSISPTQTRQEHEIDVPCTPLEQVLAETWKTILRIESIHMSDNFFDLGGHSTLATQLIFRVSKDFQMKLSPQFVFEYSTLAEFTEALLARESIAGSVTEIAEMLLKAHVMAESEQRSLTKK